MFEIIAINADTAGMPGAGMAHVVNPRLLRRSSSGLNILVQLDGKQEIVCRWGSGQVYCYETRGSVSVQGLLKEQSLGRAVGELKFQFTATKHDAGGPISEAFDRLVRKAWDWQNRRQEDRDEGSWPDVFAKWQAQAAQRFELF